MKFLVALAFVAGALATPMSLERRQTANGFTRGGCKGVMMAYARGSTELGNVGTLGPSLESGLERALNGDFALQGTEYPADLLSNVLPDGTNQRAIDQMVSDLTSAARNCPTAKLAAGGYSQGSAVACNAVQALPYDIQERVRAVVFFGYTKNLQNKGAIPGFPSDRLKVFLQHWRHGLLRHSHDHAGSSHVPHRGWQGRRLYRLQDPLLNATAAFKKHPYGGVTVEKEREEG